MEREEYTGDGSQASGGLGYSLRKNDTKKKLGSLVVLVGPLLPPTIIIHLVCGPGSSSSSP
jgi:hypothetical protein